jgi:hypothetical protein
VELHGRLGPIAVEIGEVDGPRRIDTVLIGSHLVDGRRVRARLRLRSAAKA